tara:strand:+ start:1810 stop:2277 length:468 start_codon:yes stop_codon:yes gene_type:complete
MLVEIKRFSDNGKTTLSNLFINGEFQCFGVEDTKRYVKIKHETCIPNGMYDLILRNEGSFNDRYKRKYSNIHEGMLCVVNSDNYKLITESMSFQYILFHIGNSHKHSSGCYLMNDQVNALTHIGSSSANAYKRVYPIMANHLINGGKIKVIYSEI